MSLGTYIKFGAGFGLSAGIITSAYLNREASKYEKISDLLEKESDPACRSAYLMAAYAKYLSEVALATGPFLGAYTGIGLYTAKRASICVCISRSGTNKVAFRILAIVVAAMLASKTSIPPMPEPMMTSE